PATGSAVARFRTAEAPAPTHQPEAPARGQKGSGLPPFLVIGGKLHQGKKAIIGEGGGPLGAIYDPFRLEYDPVRGTRIPALQMPDGLTPERLGDREKLLAAFGQMQRRLEKSSLDDYRGQAFALLTSSQAQG